MDDDDGTIRAADHLVDQLIAQGIERIYGVPGESFLPVLDAVHDRQARIRFTTCRQEGGAAMAAEAHGKLSGRPGVCFVTRGPGATNASAGVHVAFQDSTPMVLFIGQVARGMIEREAFQEIDFRRMFGQMAKWVAEIDDPARIQEYVTRAFRTALSGRPGPVVLSLPEDMLYERVVPPPAPARIETPRYRPIEAAMAALDELIGGAERPLVIAGGGGWTRQGVDALARFAERQGLPVAVSFRKQDLIDNDHPHYVGHLSVGRTPYLADALARADLLIAVGPRLGEMTTAGYSLIRSPVPTQALVHVFPAGEEIGRVYEPTLSLVSDTESFCRAAAERAPIAPARFAAGRQALREAYEAFAAPASVPDDPLAPYFARLDASLPRDAIVCNGAGNYAGWLHRFVRYRVPGSQLAPTSGSMGYGLPAAIAAATLAPAREVYAIAGDGCFMMTCQEMASACHHELRLTVIVVDNGRYGTIRAHQEREFPGRVSGTALTNPDFCAFARSFGAGAARVGSPDELAEAIAAARARGGVNLIEIPVARTALSPGRRLPD